MAARCWIVNPFCFWDLDSVSLDLKSSLDIGLYVLIGACTCCTVSDLKGYGTRDAGLLVLFEAQHAKNQRKYNLEHLALGHIVFPKYHISWEQLTLQRYDVLRFI